MNKTYIYSASQDAFFPISLKDIYEDAGTWPDGGVEVDDDTFEMFTSIPPEGKVRGGDKEGMPAWVDAPPLTKEQLISAAKSEIISRLEYIDYITADWRTELSLGEISDENKGKLSKWMAYKREIKSINAEDAIGEGFKWPDVAEE